MSNQPDQANVDPSGANNEWAVLQSLRHTLQAIALPWSPSVRRLFKQEEILKNLFAKPSSLSIQMPDQFPGLQQSVDALAFNEKALLESTLSQTHLRPLPELNFKTVKASRAAETQTPRHQRHQGDHSTLAAEKQRYEKHLQEPAQLINDQQLNSTELGEFFLKPEYMQRWIDEILESDHMDSNRLLHSVHNETNRIDTGDSIRTRKTTRSEGSISCDKQKDNSSAKAQSKIRYLTEKHPKREKSNTHIGQSNANSTRTTEKAALAEKKDSLLKNTSEFITSNDSNSSTPEGFALLQKLVQIKVDEVSSSPELSNASKITKPFERHYVDRHHESLSNNAAWQKIENNLSQANSAAHQNQQSLSPKPTLFDADKNKPALSDDPERIAELVNSALIDQAERNGVDLS